MDLRARLVDMKIRTAGPADADEIVQVRNDSRRAAYRDLIDGGALEKLSPVPAYSFVLDLSAPPQCWRTLIAERGPEIVGAVTVGWDTRESTAGRAGPGQPGEVRMLHVHPDHWGKRVGYALMREAHRALDEFGLSPVRAWVLEGNAVGIRFLERYGLEPDGERSVSEVGGRPCPVVRYSLPAGRKADEPS